MHRLSLFTLLLVSAGSAFLWLEGPFFIPSCSSTAKPITSEYIAGDGFIKNSVGVLEGEKEQFRSNGQAGALSFGPWVSLFPGRYSVAWYGRALSSSRPTFKILLRGDEFAISSSPIDLQPSDDIALLHREIFDVSQRMDGVEFRALVGQDDKMTLHAIRLTTISCHDR